MPVPVGTVEPEEHYEGGHQEAPCVPVVGGEGAEGGVGGGGGVGAQGGQGVVVGPQLLVVPRPTGLTTTCLFIRLETLS